MRQGGSAIRAGTANPALEGESRLAVQISGLSAFDFIGPVWVHRNKIKKLREEASYGFCGNDDMVSR